jgi:hypothetical protein
MKKFLFFLSLIFTIPVFAQNSTVSVLGLTDSDGSVWAYASVTATINNPYGGPVVYSSTGQPITAQVTATTNAIGNVTLTLARNDMTQPTSTCWNFTIQPAVNNAPSQSINCVTINSSTQNVSSILNSGITAPRISCGSSCYGYSTAEILNPVSPGAFFYNVVSSSCNQFSASGSWSVCASGSASTSFGGATGNGLTIVSATNPVSGYNSTGKLTGGLALGLFGNSLIAINSTLASQICQTANFSGSPNYGINCRSVAGTYTCDASSNATVTVNNSDGVFWNGEQFSIIGGVQPTGGMSAHIVNSQDGLYTVSSNTPTTITFATASFGADACTSTSGTISASNIATPNILKSGTYGSQMNTVFSTTLPTFITSLQLAKSQGHNPIVLHKGMLDNDLRYDVVNLAQAEAMHRQFFNQILTSTNLTGIPIIETAEDTPNSYNAGNGQICPIGSTAGGCGTTTGSSLSSSCSAGVSCTVTLNNPPGYSNSPNSFWPGPGIDGGGAPVVVSSNGNNMTVIVGTGGTQETVTVTGMTVNIVTPPSSPSASPFFPLSTPGIYTVTLTFTPVNIHNSGESVVPTAAWAAQMIADTEFYVNQYDKTLVNVYPSLLVSDIQQGLTGRYAATSKPPAMSDALHPSTTLFSIEDAAIAQIIQTYSSIPTSTFPWNGNRLHYSGQITQAVSTVPLFEYQPTIASPDTYFSGHAANLARFSWGYWNPWTYQNTANGTASYSLGCEDPQYFDNVFSGTVNTAFVANGTSLTLLGNTGTTTVSQNIRGSASGYSWVDIVAVPGQGCYSGAISSAAPANGNQLVFTINSSTIPINIPSSQLVTIQRYKVFDATGLPYYRQPRIYPYRKRDGRPYQGFFTGGASNSYQVNMVKDTLTGGSESTAVFTSINSGYFFTIATSPITSTSLDYSNIGSGTYTNNDIVTIPCTGSNATATLSVQNGYPYAVTPLTPGSGCNTATSSQAVTGGTGTGLKIFYTAGLMVLPVVGTKVLSTQIGTGSPTLYANGDTVTYTCAGTNATWTAQGVTAGVPAYLKPVNAGSSCTPGSNLATTSSGSGINLTVTVTVGPTATSCTQASNANVYLTCTDASGINYSNWNNLGFDIWSTNAPDSFAQNDVSFNDVLLNPTTNTLSTKITGCTGAINCVVKMDNLPATTYLGLGLSIPSGTATFTPGTNVTSVICAASYTCTNTRGRLTLVGGTATTGTIATVTFSAALSAAPSCQVEEPGIVAIHGVDHGIPSTTAFTISAASTVSGATLTLEYNCKP